MDHPTHEQWLADLYPAERLRYFYGQLLSAGDFQKEQDYWRRKNQLHNRFALGHGVVCGLGVSPLTTTQGNGVRISAGLALDEWGREIVISTDVDIVPLRLFDDCDPMSAGDDFLPPAVHISVCYRELAGERHPVGSVEPDVVEDRDAVGSLVESYCIRVQEGAVVDVSTGTDAEAMELLRSGRLRDALCLIAATTCPPASADPCVVLANVEVDENGSLSVDACGPRVIVPTNRLLLQLAESLTRTTTTSP